MNNWITRSLWFYFVNIEDSFLRFQPTMSELLSDTGNTFSSIFRCQVFFLSSNYFPPQQTRISQKIPHPITKEQRGVGGLPSRNSSENTLSKHWRSSCPSFVKPNWLCSSKVDVSHCVSSVLASAWMACAMKPMFILFSIWKDVFLFQLAFCVVSWEGRDRWGFGGKGYLSIWRWKKSSLEQKKKRKSKERRRQVVASLFPFFAGLTFSVKRQSWVLPASKVRRMSSFSANPTLCTDFPRGKAKWRIDARWVLRREAMCAFNWIHGFHYSDRKSWRTRFGTFTPCEFYFVNKGWKVFE